MVGGGGRCRVPLAIAIMLTGSPQNGFPHVHRIRQPEPPAPKHVLLLVPRYQVQAAAGTPSAVAGHAALHRHFGKRGDAQQAAYAAAGEFLSALSWKNGSRIAFDYVGRIGWPTAAPLRRANFRWTGPPQVPYQGHALGFDIDPIPTITNDDQRRALAMVREALSSNNVLLSFLLYWQVMEIGHARPSEWVNWVWKQPPPGFRVPTADIAKLPLGALPLGDYLWEDCRSAIAHIRRSPGKRALRFDNIDEVGRLAFSSNVVAYFARQYIKRELGLTGKMFLARKRGRAFPEFVDEASFDPRTHAYSWSAPIAKQPTLKVPRRIRRMGLSI